MRSLLLPLALLVALQAIDIAVHVATGQIEVLRILSNLVIVAGVGLAGRMQAPVWALCGALGYLGLNALFLVLFGLINPTTDSLRVPLFGFLALSLMLAAWVYRRVRALA